MTGKETEKCLSFSRRPLVTQPSKLPEFKASERMHGGGWRHFIKHALSPSLWQQTRARRTVENILESIRWSGATALHTADGVRPAVRERRRLIGPAGAAVVRPRPPHR